MLLWLISLNPPNISWRYFYVHFMNWKTQILNLKLRLRVGFELRDLRVHAFSCFAGVHLSNHEWTEISAFFAHML